MSYCVNCGVELDATAGECPLCNTPVLNPKEIERHAFQAVDAGKSGAEPFPREKGQVETANKKDLGILLSTVVLASAVIGACAILWVVMIPAVIYTKQSVYISLLLDGAVVAVYLYMLTFMTEGSGWFWGLGLPIVVLVTATAEALTACILRLPRSFLTVALYLFTAIGALCVVLEVLIDRYIEDEITIRWSAVVLVVCVVLDIALITMLSRRRLRNAVRRRLHF